MLSCGISRPEEVESSTFCILTQPDATLQSTMFTIKIKKKKTQHNPTNPTNSYNQTLQENIKI